MVVGVMDDEGLESILAESKLYIEKQMNYY